MTLNDIKTEVISLGFEYSIADSAQFICSVRRALAVIFADRPVHSEIRLYKTLPPQKRAQKRFFHSSGIDNSFSCETGAYSFFVSGTGSFSVTDGGGERIYSFDTEAKRFSGFINGSGAIRFFGELFFSVYSFFLFPGYLTGKSEDIPTLSGYEEYRLDRLCNDYLSSDGAPKDSTGDAIRGAYVCSEIARIPSDYEGEIRIEYKRRAPEVSLEDAERELSLPTDVLHLIPLLSAAYIWLDDDPEKAYYYMSLYREGMATLKASGTRCSGGTVKDVSGWAT